MPDAYDKVHDQTYLWDANHQLTERLIRRATENQAKGMVLGLTLLQ